jgi:hypothetical protein
MADEYLSRIDRRRLLQIRSNSLRAIWLHPELPHQVKELYKLAADKAQVALGLDAARRRRAAKGKGGQG